MLKVGQTPIELPGIVKAYMGTTQIYGLPAEYRKINGIIFGGDTYYEITDFKLRGSDTVRLSVSVDNNCNVFGCYTSTTSQDNYSLFFSNTSSARYLRYNGSTYNSYLPTNLRGETFNLTITPTGSLGFPTDDNWTQQNFTSTVDMCIGTTGVNVTSAKLDGTIYGDFIVDNRFHAIPCERISDGKIGYFDLYTDTFYAPIGSNPAELT